MESLLFIIFVVVIGIGLFILTKTDNEISEYQASRFEINLMALKMLRNFKEVLEKNNLDYQKEINIAPQGKLPAEKKIKIEDSEVFKNPNIYTFENQIQSIITLGEQEKQQIQEEIKKTDELLNIRKQQLEKDFEQIENAFKKVEEAKVKDIPFFATIYSDYKKALFDKEARLLETKTRPAYSAAEKVRDLSLKHKACIQELKVAQYTNAFYETLIPWLPELVDENTPLIKEKEDYSDQDKDFTDKAQYWLSPEEYKNLSTTEKYQKALDRYFNRNKSNAEIGRDYERYVGYLYEQQGYNVEYKGIIAGLEDLGRDLICTKNNKALIIQCKCWSKTKTIHEKHINQLFGTTVRYYLEQTNGKTTLADFYNSITKGEIVPLFITSTILSDTAKSFANSLGIQCKENLKLEMYPTIKCNINKSTGEYIYHLPFDQQYDKTSIKDIGECYALTVTEAEQKGFRRAMKWLGNSN